MVDSNLQSEQLRAQNDAVNALRTTIHVQEQAANRNLQVLNGGGTVALLAFLGQTWSTAAELRAVLAISIGIMAAGLCLAVWGGFQLPDYTECGFRQGESDRAAKNYNKLRKRYFWTTGLSFVFFVVSVIIVLAGVLCFR